MVTTIDTSNAAISPKPKHDKLCILRESYLNLINKLAPKVDKKVRYCAALSINYHYHCQQWKVKVHRTPWWYQKLKQIHKDFLGLFSLHVVRASQELLIDLGLLERRFNPGNGQDKTYQYNLRWDKVQAALAAMRNQPAAETLTVSKTKAAKAKCGSKARRFRSESEGLTVEHHTKIQSEAIRSNSQEESELENFYNPEPNTADQAEEELLCDNAVLDVEEEMLCDNAVLDVEEELLCDNAVLDVEEELLCDNAGFDVEEELLCDNAGFDVEEELLCDNAGFDVEEELLCDNVGLDDVWESQEQPSCHQEPSSAPPKPRKSKKINARQSKICSAFLLDEPVFIQWWVNRLLKTKFGTEELVLTPQAFVRSSIRKHPEQALDMWDSFQSEMSHRVENYNTRVEHGCQISREEQEQIQAIAPFATPIERVAALPESRPEAPAQSVAVLPESQPLSPAQPKASIQVEAPPDAENPDAYQEWKCTQEFAPAPEGFFQQMMTRITGKMSMPKAEKVQRRSVVSELERLNADILDPVLRPEVLRRVMASDCYVVDFDEQGVPYQVRRL
jgi:hypothetical protein